MVHQSEKAKMLTGELRATDSELERSPMAPMVTALCRDYGYNIRIGHNAFINCDCVSLDGAPIEIADDLRWARRSSLCRTHPLDRRSRDSGAIGAPDPTERRVDRRRSSFCRE